MKIDRATSAVIVALLTGATGLGTAIVNRYTPNVASVSESEKKGRRSYKALKKSLGNIAEDVDANAKRMDLLEHTIALQNRTIQFLMSDVGVHPPSVVVPKLPDDPEGLRKKRVPTRLRGAAPTYDTAQQAR